MISELKASWGIGKVTHGVSILGDKPDSLNLILGLPHAHHICVLVVIYCVT